VSYLAPFLIYYKPSEYAATAFTMLKMFGLEHEVNKLLGKQVNSLSNVLTLRHELHQAFDRFDIWLEEVPGKVRFILCSNLSSLSSRNNKILNPRKIHIKW
jgi:HNH endonuclease